MKLIKLKKSPVFLLFIVLLSALVIAQTVIMVAGEVTTIYGAKDVPFPIYLDNNESVAGLQVEVNYETPFLIFKNIEPTSRIPDATVITNNQPPILKIALLVNNDSEQISAGNGALFNIIFDVNESAVPGEYDISLSDVVISNIETLSLPFSVNDGVFNIVQPYNITFLPPISNQENFTLQEGSTLPLKFNVTNNTDFVNDDSVRVTIFNNTIGFSKEYNASGSGNDFITINDGELYIVNIHTGQLNMSVGDYDIEVAFDNFQKAEIGFELVNKTAGIGRGKKKGHS